MLLDLTRPFGGTWLEVLPSATTQFFGHFYYIHAWWHLFTGRQFDFKVEPGLVFYMLGRFFFCLLLFGIPFMQVSYAICGMDITDSLSVESAKQKGTVI